MKNLAGFNSLVYKNVTIFILIIMMLILSTSLVQAEDKIIKVGLANETENIEISSGQGIKIKTSDGYSLHLTETTHFEFKKVGQFVRINNYFFASDYILVYPLGEKMLTIDSREYKGSIKLLNNSQTMTVINKVKMIDYLASVIGSEIDPEWPLAALKAQAVVARTYALRNLNSHASQGYHLSNTIYSQVYKGYHVTTDKIYQAVKSTAGQVLTYDGKLISAVYHSNAGGKTAQGAVIWGGDTPYLQSVNSNDHYAPNYKWQKKYSITEIIEILNAKGISLTTINRIGFQGLGPSGRSEKIVIDGNGQEVSVDSSDFRFWLNLRSTKFSIEKYDNGYLFKGKGWGHGVGMSQWGAYQMAKEGSAYQEILYHYYQNTKLVKKDVGGIDNEG